VSSRVCCLIDAKLGGMTLKSGLALVEEEFGEEAQVDVFVECVDECWGEEKKGREGKGREKPERSLWQGVSYSETS